jgi:hypothetical protein
MDRLGQLSQYPRQSRLLTVTDLQHLPLQLTFGSELMICPIDKEKTVYRALDVGTGTGTGIWEINYGDLSISIL